MEQDGIGPYTKSFGLSLAITTILSAFLVVLKETHEDTVFAWMKAATGHHWITHGVLDVIVFLGLGWALSRLNNGQGIRLTPKVLIVWLTGSVVLGALIICVFYL
ncbi:MAG: hypothetical protein GXP31_17280 [Kiritimatiellaeota bacterium]|nr:hypothetical protein [Kiritimatiellota bacterium]